MAKKGDSGLAKRFGSRYGRKTRQKYAMIEAESRKTHKCPYCAKKGVKRIAIGIWECRKCNTKFTGKAYSPTKKIVVSEEKEKAEEYPDIEETETKEEEETESSEKKKEEE